MLHSFPRGEVVPEEPLTDPQLPTADKARLIREQFIAFFKVCSPVVSSVEAYHVLLEMCNTAMAEPGTAEDLSASSDTATCEDILPDARVIAAMYDEFVVHNARRSPELEGFIDQSRISG
jgi:hypothetical protein